MIAFLSRLLGRRPKPKSSPLIEVPEEWMPPRGMETGLLVDKPMPRASWRSLPSPVNPFHSKTQS